MTMGEAQLSLQVMAEERIGALQRQRASEAKAIEDAAFGAAAAAAREA